MIKCPKCKYPVAEENDMCPFCGWKLAEPYQEILKESPCPSQKTPSDEELRRREKENAAAASREAEEKRKAEQKRLAAENQLKEDIRADLKKKLDAAEALVAGQKKVSTRWTVLLIVSLILAVAGFFGRNANNETSRREQVPVEEFAAWSENTSTGNGVTFRFSSIDDMYVRTTTTSTGTSRVSIPTGKSYTGYYVVSDDAGQKVVLYTRISGEKQLGKKLASFFPEILLITSGDDDIPYLPEGITPTAVGIYRTASSAMDSYNLNASSKPIYERLSSYPFIDLDSTTVYRTVTIEGAAQRRSVFAWILAFGILLCIVMFYLRKTSVRKETMLMQNVRQLKQAISRL